MRRLTLSHRYVEFIPKDLEEGVVFISRRFNTASHLCCCGCGLRVVTPLNPSKWRLTDHGETVSLSPSIGLGKFPCRSHYWIRQSRVDWYPDMTEAQTARAEQADQYASREYTGEEAAGPRRVPSFTEVVKAIWKDLVQWFRSLWK